MSPQRPGYLPPGFVMMQVPTGQIVPHVLGQNMANFVNPQPYQSFHNQLQPAPRPIYEAKGENLDPNRHLQSVRGRCGKRGNVHGGSQGFDQTRRQSVGDYNNSQFENRSRRESNASFANKYSTRPVSLLQHCLP